MQSGIKRMQPTTKYGHTWLPQRHSVGHRTKTRRGHKTSWHGVAVPMNDNNWQLNIPLNVKAI